MNGSKTTMKTIDEMRIAQKLGEDQSDWERVRAAGDFEWDGHDDEDRPLSKAEMRAAIIRTKQSPKVSTTILLDADVLAYFRATGKGWQDHIGNVLKEYAASH